MPQVTLDINHEDDEVSMKDIQMIQRILYEFLVNRPLREEIQRTMLNNLDKLGKERLKERLHGLVLEYEASFDSTNPALNNLLPPADQMGDPDEVY